VPEPLSQRNPPRAVSIWDPYYMVRPGLRGGRDSHPSEGRLEAEDRRPAVNSDEPCRPADLERAAAALSVGIYCASLR